VEASRRHGAFDTRWLYADKHSLGAVRTPPPLRAEEAAVALDWDAFANRFFHERRRHDSQARSAYLAYKQGREWRTTPARLSLVPVEPASAPVVWEPDAAGTRRLLAAMAAKYAPEA
jgi:hypothetical protein